MHADKWIEESCLYLEIFPIILLFYKREGLSVSIHFENKPENPEFPIEFSRVHAGKNHNGAWMNWHINIEILHILEGSGYVLCHGNHIAVTLSLIHI